MARVAPPTQRRARRGPGGAHLRDRPPHRFWALRPCRRYHLCNSKSLPRTLDFVRSPRFSSKGSDVPRYGLGLNEGLKGQDGLELKEYWESLKGPEAYLGLAVPNVS